MGSVHAYETKAGKRYYISYRRPGHKQTKERGFRTQKAAKERLAEVDVSKNTGTYIEPQDTRVSIAALVKPWLAARESVVKPSTYRMDESAWRVHVDPRWGKTQVGKVKHSDVQDWVSELSAASSATTVLRAYGILAAVLDRAVKDRRILENPARGVTLPSKASARRIYLTHEQVDLLAEQSRRPELIRFLAYTGLRWGEATGLQVRHVDVNRRRVAVEQNAVMVGTTIKIGTPKTHERRSVPYPLFLAPAITDSMKRKPADGYLFGPGADPLRLPNSVNGWFAAAVKRAQSKTEEARQEALERDAEPPTHFPRITPHDLRHAAASLAISAGANVKAVQRMLGHKSAAMTLDTYADLFDDDLDGVAVALDQARARSVVPKGVPTSTP